MIKSLQNYTQTEKGLIYLNSIACLSLFVFLFLTPILASIAGLRSILFIGAIALLVINVAFYVAPQSIKGKILTQRLLFVYIPSLVVIGISIWDLIDIGKIINIIYLLYTIVVISQAVTFGMLVAKVGSAAGSQPLLGK